MKNAGTKSPTRAARTRTAIVEALTEILVASDDGGFSVQEVADRAGVTHRTVYNHFPTREALLDALMEHRERGVADGSSSPLDEVGLSLAAFPSLVRRLYELSGAHETEARAIARLIASSRRHGAPTQARTRQFEQLFADEIDGLSPEVARRLTAAVRLFGTQLGWHLLTEHFALDNDTARDTAEWAVRVLIDAALAGNLPIPTDHAAPGEPSDD